MFWIGVQIKIGLCTIELQDCVGVVLHFRADPVITRREPHSSVRRGLG